MHGLGVTDPGSRSPSTARIFVFVCFGNIMRSPMCEALMKQELGAYSNQIKVSSAGLHATAGRAAHAWALAAARELGISLDDHRSQQLTAEMVDQADAIFAMDYQNQVELLAQYPQAKEKIFRLRAYEGAPVRRAEIRDPYYGDLEQTLECYRLLQKCIKNVASGVLRSLASEPPLSPADSANVNENLNFSTRHMLVTPFGAAPEILAPLWKVKIITDSELRSIRHSLRRDLLSSDDAAED